jgi:hypothetical protein
VDDKPELTTEEADLKARELIAKASALLDQLHLTFTAISDLLMSSEEDDVA